MKNPEYKPNPESQLHSCNWPECPTILGENRWACTKHWPRIPPQLRIDLWNAVGNRISTQIAENKIKAWMAIAELTKLRGINE
jgi:hypothetical protein